MKWFLISLLSFTSFFGTEPSTHFLRQRFSKENEGHYIVAESGKTVTIIHIRSITDTSLILEEISAPLKNLKKRTVSWPEWVKNKAPGHSSWSVTEINLKNGEVVQCYSFSKRCQINLSKKESLFATLLDLPLKKVPSEKQRRIGPPPSDGEIDLRKTWRPPFLFEGKAVEKPLFDILETTWPKDGTELSGKVITLYFDHDRKISLPLWIQVETSHAIGNFRAIDSGHYLPFPRK